MSMPANALQAGIYGRLTGYSPLTNALGGSYVYDHVPQGTPSPYVRFGELTLINSDTKTANGWEITFQTHCWTFEVAGAKTVQTLMGHVFDALHRAESSITVSGFTLVNIAWDFQTVIQETAEEGANDHY